MFYDPVGLSNELSCEAWSFSPHYNTQRFLQPKVLRLSFPTLNPGLHDPSGSPVVSPDLSTHKCGTTQSTSQHLAMCPLHPSCLSPPLLPVWINVSSLTPWLSDFHTVQFSGSSGCCFVFKFVVVLLLFVRGGTVHLPTPLSWVEVQSLLSLSLFY